MNTPRSMQAAARVRTERATWKQALLDPAVVALAAATVRLLYFLEYRSSPFYEFLHLDPRYYHDWALRILHGDWIGAEVFEQSPLYPYLMAIFFAIFGHDLTLLRLAQFALGCLTAALTCALARKLFGRAAGIVAGIGAAIYGPFLFYEGQVMKEFLTPLFSVGTLLLLYHALDGGPRARRLFALAGACIGLAALVRDNFLMLAPIFGLYLLARGRNLAGALDAAAIGAGALAVLIPCAVRNYYVSGDLVLTTSGGGEVFYIGNGPYANGAYSPPPWVRANPRFEHEDFRKRARELTGRDLTRKEASDFWYHEGWKTIGDNWRSYPRLLIRKALMFLNNHELPDNYSYYSFTRFSRVLSLLPTFVCVAALALPGLVVSLPRWRETIPLHLAGAGYMASVLIFFNFSRFRLPFIPVMLVFAGAGAAAIGRAAIALWRRREPMTRALPRAALLVAASIGAVIFTTLHIRAGVEDPYQDRLHLAAALSGAGRNDEAEGLLRQTIQEAEAILRQHGWVPGAPSVPGGITFALSLHAAHRDLSEILLKENRVDDAIAEMNAAIPLDPNDADLFQKLGGAYRKKGDAASAVRAYERGLSIAPGAFTQRFDLAVALYESGDGPAALRQMEEARARNPRLAGLDLADWHYGMGTILWETPGRHREAIEHFREGLRLNPEHQQAAEVRSLLSAAGG